MNFRYLSQMLIVYSGTYFIWVHLLSHQETPELSQNVKHVSGQRSRIFSKELKVLFKNLSLLFLIHKKKFQKLRMVLFMNMTCLKTENFIKCDSHQVCGEIWQLTVKYIKDLKYFCLIKTKQILIGPYWKPLVQIQFKRSVVLAEFRFKSQPLVQSWFWS